MNVLPIEKKQLLDEINRLEALRSVYSDRDRVRLGQIEKELRELDLRLLDMMVEENIAS